MCDIRGSESADTGGSVCKNAHESNPLTTSASMLSCDSFVSCSTDFQERDDGHGDQSSLDTGQNSLDNTPPLRDIRVIGGPGDTAAFHSFDPTLWAPPEPQDMEDDVDGSDLGDATIWGPLSRLCEDRSVRFKHQFHKAMTFTMNGRFKILVTRLLKSQGILISNDPGGSWVDIVTSLAWEAALLIAPETTGGEIIDPQDSLKVKCIATGLCSQSQLIKGLAFKKNAAHKHMQTKHERPRLLLLQGMLGHTSTGLSSFDVMNQEKDNLKSIVEMIETCRPNVVLVEKTVSRDVQESFLAKGITLVFDMKLHRLQRIARYTDSKIFSLDDSLSSQKLKQCQSFYFEKFVEEHGIPREGGKKPMKTLMLLEGYHRSLGCTVLLKGAHSEVLKKVKYVLHSAIGVAYHLILETSFLIDHSEMFSTTHILNVDDFAKEESTVVGPSIFQKAASLKESLDMDLPSSDGSGEAPACEGTSDDSMDSAMHGARSDASFHDKDIGQGQFGRRKESGSNGINQLGKPHNDTAGTILPGQLMSSISTSLKEVTRESSPLVPPASCWSFSTHMGSKQNKRDSITRFVLPPHLPSVEYAYCDIEIKDNSDVAESSVGEPLGCEVPVELCNADVNDEADQLEIKDSDFAVLDAQSILYLLSSRNVSRKPSCYQSRLWRVKYYKNFDVSLGEFLHGILNQMHQCAVCSEAHEAHVYNYVNLRGKLTLQVKNLSADQCLPGEAEGKLWMWAQCSKCVSANKSQGSTRRVVMSMSARGLSFGKFLELSFSSNSSLRGLSGCGHALQTDYLRFYGLGPMVTMFSYSPVKIYSARLPPPVLDFNTLIGQDWIQKETERVLEKGMLLFTEVTDLLQKIESDIFSSNSIPPGNLAGLAKRFSDVREMLKEEKFDFEAKIQKKIDKNDRLRQSVQEFLSFNSLIQELVLESYVWDRRLLSVMSNEYGKFAMDLTHKPKVKEVQLQDQKNGIDGSKVEGRIDTSKSVPEETISVLIDRNESNMYSSLRNCNDIINHGKDAEMDMKLDGMSVRDVEHSSRGFVHSEHQCEGFIQGSIEENGRFCSSVDSQSDGRLTLVTHGTALPVRHASSASGYLNDSFLHQDSYINLSDSFPSLPTHDGNHQEHLSIPKPFSMEKAIPIIGDCNDDSFANSNVHASAYSEGSSVFSGHRLESCLSTSSSSLAFNIDDLQDMVWSSFSEICKTYKKDLQRGGSRKFGFVDSYTPQCLSQANHLMTWKGCRLHVPLGLDDYVVSAYEDEPTSIIACALAMLHEEHNSDENLVEKASGKGEREIKSFIDNAPSLDSDISVESPYWSSNGSLDTQGINSVESATPAVSESFFDSAALVDPMLTMENPHPEILLLDGKLQGKYSVVCLYEKQFRALRRHCCPCELDYIASLSHCKNWDAKGGKSGALFVKTLDDRFIIKQIQKTELDSFLKFASQYFVYANKSLSSGSQTCLAKILGIYQVTIRQPKSGKEVKYDLIVMENLLFGKTVTRLYDLKGAEYARYTKDTDGTGKVFLDTNFVEDMDISPLYISVKNKHLLQRAVWNDTSFLTSINVMDYSLLVGVDTERHELVCGIIDYLRQYTWDKHLETWVKTSLVPKNVTPTVVSPKEYKKRFRKFMDLHFLSIPDHSRPEI